MEKVIALNTPGFSYTKSRQNALVNQFIDRIDVNAQIISHFIGRQNFRHIMAFINVNIETAHQLTTFLCAI